MKTYYIFIVLERRPSDAEVDAFVKQNAGDATFGTDHGASVVEFDRQASSESAAIDSAVKELEAAGIHAVSVVATEGE